MKRFAPFITCCYLCSLFLPLSLRANVLPVSESTVTGAAADDYYKSSRAQLKVLSSNKVGQTLVASEALSSTAALSGLVSGAAGLAGVAYYERTGKDPVYAAFDAVATAADALFVPAYQAFKANFVSPESFPASAAQYVGVEGSVGATVGNLVATALNDLSDRYANLKAAINSVSGTNYNSSDAPEIGETFVTKAGETRVILSINASITRILTQSWKEGDYASFVQGYAGQILYDHTSGLIFVRTSDSPHEWQGQMYYSVVAYGSNPTTAPNPFSNPYTDVVDYDGLKEALSSPSPEVAAEIKDAVKNMPADQKITSSDPAPETVPSSSPQPITNTQIQNFFAQNTTNVYNKTLETITNNATSTTTEISNEVAGAAAEAAKAQEEEATKETEETFSPISDSAFTEPYNPGEFDIPARFTQFLNNVKSSGLFSFSNDFFNSLPGGGSPIFEIEGGIFGSHRIDLSETMSGGLAVLKTVLLALFGFLSIRAVIMKR